MLDHGCAKPTVLKLTCSLNTMASRTPPSVQLLCQAVGRDDIVTMIPPSELAAAALVVCTPAATRCRVQAALTLALGHVSETRLAATVERLSELPAAKSEGMLTPRGPLELKLDDEPEPEHQPEPQISSSSCAQSPPQA